MFQDLTSSLKTGEKKIQATISYAEKTMQETAPPGQEQIKTELESLNLEFEDLVTKLGDTHVSLTHAIEALQAYDKSCDLLLKWLKGVELQIKDQELKSTCQEKQAQVNKYKVRLIDIVCHLIQILNSNCMTETKAGKAYLAYFILNNDLILEIQVTQVFLFHLHLMHM